jgi:hypothetical protein
MPDFKIALLTAFLPLLVGFVWYHPKVFGTMWMKTIGIVADESQKGNMLKTFGLTYLCGIFISAALYPIVIHQMGIFSTLATDSIALKDPNSEVGALLANLTAKYGHNFRTFKHGTLHGAMTGFLFATPVIAINSLFEKKTFQYIAIHAGYWILTLALMGGVICAFA